MKHLILGAALCLCFAACKGTSNTAVDDPNSANMPKAECNGCPGKAGAECTGKSECTGQKADCCTKTAKPQG